MLCVCLAVVVAAAAPEYCIGYMDSDGQWNNGFYCPQWGDIQRNYCCGTLTHRYCCPPPEGHAEEHEQERPASNDGDDLYR